MRQQHTPMRFDPNLGTLHPWPYDARAWRSKRAADARLYPSARINTVWRFNPWTGKKRHPLDIESDPHGLLIIPPHEELYA